MRFYMNNRVKQFNVQGSRSKTQGSGFERLVPCILFVVSCALLSHGSTVIFLPAILQCTLLSSNILNTSVILLLRGISPSNFSAGILPAYSMVTSYHLEISRMTVSTSSSVN